MSGACYRLNGDVPIIWEDTTVREQMDEKTKECCIPGCRKPVRPLPIVIRGEEFYFCAEDEKIHLAKMRPVKLPPKRHRPR